MSKIERAAQYYVQQQINGMIDHDIDTGDMERAFVAGVEWQSDKSAIMTSEAIQLAIIRHNSDEQKRVLKNYRQICGCFYQGTCTVDCKKCTFMRCEKLKELFNEEPLKP